MLKLVYNTTPGPLLVDDSGFVIGGRSWGVVDTTDPIGSAELDADRLVFADEDAAADSEHPEVIAALAALAERRARREAASAADKSALIDALPAEVVNGLPVGGDDLPAKADLVEAVEDTETDLPAPADPDTTSKATASKAKTPRSGN